MGRGSVITSSGLDWERFGVITGGDEVCIFGGYTHFVHYSLIFVSRAVTILYYSRETRHWHPSPVAPSPCVCWVLGARHATAGLRSLLCVAGGALRGVYD